MRIRSTLHKSMYRLYIHRLIFNCIVASVALVTLFIADLPAQVFVAEWGALGSGDGQFSAPRGIAVDDSGNVYVADTGNNRIQKFDNNGNFLLKWGSAGTENGQFNAPVDVAVDTAGNIHVVELGNDRIQKFDPSGLLQLVWGTEGTSSSQFNAPNGIGADTLGFVYVADSGNNRIQKFNLGGGFIQLWGSSGLNFGQFNTPTDVAVDDSGFVYVVDRDNYRIQKFNAATVFQLKWGAQGSEDQRFELPHGIAIDDARRFYVADEHNHRIQLFDFLGTLQLKWGTAGSSQSQFNQPASVATDKLNNVFVLDSGNNRVQKFLINTRPVAKRDTVSGSGGVLLPISLSGTDADADSLTAIISSLPVAGQLFQTSDGTTQGAEITTVPTAVSDSLRRVLFLSAATSSGQPYSFFNFRVDDSILQSDEETLVINITSSNAAPTISSNVTLFVNEGEAVTIFNGNLRVSDAEDLGQNIIVRAIVPPQHGQLSSNVFTQSNVDQGTITYSHNGDEVIADSISFRVEDTAGGLAYFTFNISVRSINDAPNLTDPGDPQVDEGQALVVPFDIKDPDSSELVYTIQTTPAGMFIANDTLRWVPTYEQAGTYPLRIDVEDDAGGTDFITLTVTVNEVSPPALVPDSLALDFGSVKVGTVVQDTLVYVNPLEFSLEVASLGIDAAEFVLVEPAAPFTIGPRDSVGIVINFTPVFGVFDTTQGTLSGTSNFGDLAVPLAGSSLWTNPTIDVEALDFGAVPVSGMQQLSFVVSTVGTVPLIVTSIASGDSQFVADKDSLAIESGGQDTVSVTFMPTLEGQVNTFLSLTAADTVLQLPLSGLGGQPFEGGIFIDFILAAGDQGQRQAGGARSGRLYELELYIEGAPEVVAWTAQLDLDSEKLAYVEGSATAGSFLADAQLEVAVQEAGIEVSGTAVQATPSASGDGVLVQLSIAVQEAFVDQSTLVLSSFVLDLPGGGTIADAPGLVATVDTAAVPGFLAGDFDQDGVIGFTDFFLFADVFGEPVPPVPVRFNLVDDSAIGFPDFFVFADLFGDRRGEVAKLMALAEELIGLPRSFELRPNYPNPFNPQTTLEYTLPQETAVRLEIYDMAGQRVRQLVRQVQGVGVYRVEWDGRDEHGRQVGSGVYLGRLEAGALGQTRKMLLLK